MKIIEAILRRQLNEPIDEKYPDFEQMWTRMEQAGATLPKVPDHARSRKASQSGLKNWRGAVLAASLSIILAAVPVYAAVQYDWSGLLWNKGGVQAALAQNLGQPLEQSLSRDGVTLTLHTAIADENRTVILYSLDVGDRPDGKMWDIEDLSLVGEDGQTGKIEFNNQEWDEANRRYTGYLESDWVPGQNTTQVKVVAKQIQEYSEQKVDLPLDVHAEEIQSFPVQRDGIEKVEVQVFRQEGGKLLFSSATTFDPSTSTEAKPAIFPRIVAYRDGAAVEPLPGNTFGTPGEHGEYTSQQFYGTSAVPADGTQYKFHYTKIEKSVDGPWEFNLLLNRDQMESGTTKTMLSVPLEAGSTDHIIEEMVITPTQIRLNVRSKEKTAPLPYQNYQLEVDGKVMEGAIWPSSELGLSILRFERTGELEITPETPIVLIGKHKVVRHEGEKTPVLLSNISAERQTLTTQIGGYPVKWTYYMLDENLYVETESADIHFGGVNQTHIGLGKERMIGRPVTVNFSGDGNNKAIDVYKGFKGKEASVYMFYYTTEDPEKETRVELQP